MTNNGSENMSASRRKRIETEKKIKEDKKKEKLRLIPGLVLAAVTAAAVIFCIAVPACRNIYVRTHLTQPSSEYSLLINDDGTIKDADVSKMIEAADPKDTVIKVEEPDEADIEEEIKGQLEAFKTLNTDKELVVKDQDEINLDYTGRIGGEAFDGGSTNGEGADLIIGSGTYIDGFEEQLTGSHPGDKVTVTVTFPEDYKAEGLAGREAEFECVINGIYSVPEFNDEFVKKNLAGFAEGYEDTAEGYRRYVRDGQFGDNLESALTEYIAGNSKVKKYPKEYLQHTKEVSRYSDEILFNQTNSLYEQMSYESPYADFYAFAGAENGVQYEEVLTAQAKEAVRDDMAYQYLYQKYGLKVTDEEYLEFMGTMGMTEDVYGKGYIMQQAVRQKVIEHLKETVNAEPAAEEKSGTANTAAG